LQERLEKAMLRCSATSPLGAPPLFHPPLLG
jgi:hypothetical protein